MTDHTSSSCDNRYQYPGTGQRLAWPEYLRVVAQDLEDTHSDEIGLYLANYITALSLQAENLRAKTPAEHAQKAQ